MIPSLQYKIKYNKEGNFILLDYEFKENIKYLIDNTDI